MSNDATKQEFDFDEVTARMCDSLRNRNNAHFVVVLCEDGQLHTSRYLPDSMSDSDKEKAVLSLSHAAVQGLPVSEYMRIMANVAEEAAGEVARKLSEQGAQPASGPTGPKPEVRASVTNHGKE